MAKTGTMITWRKVLASAKDRYCSLLITVIDTIAINGKSRHRLGTCITSGLQMVSIERITDL